MHKSSQFRALITHALFSGDLRRLFLYTAGRTMAPGGGRGSGGGSAPKDETVIMGGQTLRRVMDESTRQWVYRPVDEASGDVITKEAFEARRLEERRLRAEADPRKQAEREKRWLAQQRGEIRNARVEESRAMRRDEHAPRQPHDEAVRPSVRRRGRRLDHRANDRHAATWTGHQDNDNKDDNSNGAYTCHVAGRRGSSTVHRGCAAPHGDAATPC